MASEALIAFGFLALAALGLTAWLGALWGMRHAQKPTEEPDDWVRRVELQRAEFERDHFRRQFETVRDNQFLQHRVMAAVSSGEGDLWELHQPDPPLAYSAGRMAGDLKVLLVANLKGGVGKTTVATNLAAYFDRVRGMRVLLIDLDYQGSLSDMTLSAAGLEVVESRVDPLMRPGANGPMVLRAAVPLTGVLPSTAIVPCQYPLAKTETQMLFAWVFQEPAGDSRFALAGAIWSQEVRDRFDMVIIDAPPRASFTMVNGLAACTHVLMPTRLDMLSIEATPNAMAFFAQIREDLDLRWKFMGAVPTMTNYAPGLSQSEQGRHAALARYVDEAGEGRVFDRHIPNMADITHAAGRKIAFLEYVKVADIFTQLGEECAAEMGLPPRAGRGRDPGWGLG